MALYLKLSDACGEYKVRVEFQDDQGACLSKLQGITMTVGDRQADFGIGFQGYNLLLPKAGTYFLKVFFNDEQADIDIKFDAREKGAQNAADAAN
jgi:hypothetical protein